MRWRPEANQPATFFSLGTLIKVFVHRQIDIKQEMSMQPHAVQTFDVDSCFAFRDWYRCLLEPDFEAQGSPAKNGKQRKWNVNGTMKYVSIVQIAFLNLWSQQFCFGAMAEEGFVDISEEQDGGLLKKILNEGHGEETPTPGSSVVVHYVGTLHEDGSKFDSSRDRDSHFKFEVGVGQVIKGWDKGILTMKRGEKCILRCRSDYGYGKHGSPPKIPGDATLNFEVELFSWKEKVKAPSEMSIEERREHATKMKESGTEAFKQGDFATAVNRYEDGVEYITYDPNSDDFGHGGHGHSHGGMPCSGHGQDEEEKSEPVELSESDKQLALALLNNSAMARLKNGEPESAKFDCTKALQYDPKNVKATFRRAQAEFALHNFKACLEDASKTLELDPSNKEAEALKRKAVDGEKKEKKQEKAMYSKMFG